MSAARRAPIQTMLRLRSDRAALALLVLGLIALAIGIVAMALGSGFGAWLGLVGFVLTFSVLAYAIYFRA